MAESPRLMGRNGAIWREYCRGATQEDLALKYGITQQQISDTIRRVADSIPEVERRELIAQEIDFFRQLRIEALRLWDAKPVPMVAGKDGDYVLDPETHEVARDHAGRLAALARIESLSARMHKLLGLDAAQKLDVNNIGEEAAAQRAAAEAAAHLHGGEQE